MVPMESRDHEGVPLLVWRVYDRFKPLKGSEGWSRDLAKIENLHIILIYT